jgi:uncharacterized protein YndB with AHSA1/START domain
MTAHDTGSSGDREIVITRVVEAPRELVWQAWTDPKLVPQWWGPRGFTTTTHTMEVKPGGVWRFVMHGPDGRDREAGALVYKHGGDEDLEPVQFQTTVTFEDFGGQTKLTLRMVFPSAEERDRVVKEYGAIEGGHQTLARLSEQLASTAGRSG